MGSFGSSSRARWNSSVHRIIALAGWRLEAIPKWPDVGADWYFWRLMDTTTAARVSAWGLYLLHQLAAWGLIYFAQTWVKKYVPGLHPINVIALAGNALFIGLHFAQTHLWYGGLAEDVSIWSSQVSVIILLVWVLLMENSAPRALLRQESADLQADHRLGRASITATSLPGPPSILSGIIRWRAPGATSSASSTCSC